MDKGSFCHIVTQEKKFWTEFPRWLENSAKGIYKTIMENKRDNFYKSFSFRVLNKS